MREFTFEVDEEKDERGEAWLVPVKAESVAKKGGEEPTSSEVVDGEAQAVVVDKHRPLYN